MISVTSDKNKYHSRYPFRFSFIKVWFVAILLFAIFMILVQIVLNNSRTPFSKDEIFEYKVLDHLTPDYPAPLHFNIFE